MNFFDGLTIGVSFFIIGVCVTLALVWSELKKGE